MKPRNAKGFTLVQIIIVCVIVGVLSAISTVVYVRVRSAAKDGECLRNLAQIGQALQMYSENSDGAAPPYLTRGLGATKGLDRWVPAKPREWRDSLAAYTKSTAVFFCPRDEIRGIDGRNWDSTFSSYETLGVQPEIEIGLDGSYQMILKSNLDSTFCYAADIIFPAIKDADGRIEHTWLSRHGERANCLLINGSVKYRSVNGPDK